MLKQFKGRTQSAIVELGFLPLSFCLVWQLSCWHQKPHLQWLIHLGLGDQFTATRSPPRCLHKGILYSNRVVGLALVCIPKLTWFITLVGQISSYKLCYCTKTPARTLLVHLPLEVLQCSSTCNHAQKLTSSRTQDHDNRHTFLFETTWSIASRTSKTARAEGESLRVALLPNEVRQSVSIGCCN